VNLLTEPWLPVRKRDGGREWVDPSQLARPDIVAFDADRADFNGALAQFAIGLLQTTTPVEKHSGWRKLFDEPPDAGTLAQWFAPVAGAFEFDGDGDGVRFMQDLTLTAEEGTACDIAAMLIEAPGDNTVKDNKDLFVKRGLVGSLCPACAATALFTLQLNAPSGGAGHRTGLRGGGPLTTLLLASEGSSLWHHLWLNVVERAAFSDGDPSQWSAPHLTFPWLAPMTAIQKDGGETAPAQVHPAHVFWAMPRRIRLNLDGRSHGVCGLCARPSETMVSAYRTRNYGLNYKGAWNHPLAPYYAMDDNWLPLHPQPGGLGHRQWLAWVMGQGSERKKQRRARVVEHFLTHRQRVAPGALRLWAFGYDLDNMKARCWYESTLPLYGLADCAVDAQKLVEAEVARWLDATELAAMMLRGAIKDSWFSEAPSKADFSAIDSTFWGATEVTFYAQLRYLIESAASGSTFDAITVNTKWQSALEQHAMRLFDKQFVGPGPVAQQQPRRIAEAYQRLANGLKGPKLREALGLPVDPAKAAARKAASTTKPKASKS
jgi:CRISPR system Cascade subunit CasA